MTDPIADLLTRIRNAHLAGHTQVDMPHSKLKAAVAAVLVEHKYIEACEVVEATPRPVLKLTLKYVGKVPAISQLRRISKPGRRTYSSAKKLPKTLGGYGLTIVTTSRGVMTDQQARQQNVGGEILCQIW